MFEKISFPRHLNPESSRKKKETRFCISKTKDYYHSLSIFHSQLSPISLFFNYDVYQNCPIITHDI